MLLRKRDYSFTNGSSLSGFFNLWSTEFIIFKCVLLMIGLFKNDSLVFR